MKKRRAAPWVSIVAFFACSAARAEGIAQKDPASFGLIDQIIADSSVYSPQLMSGRHFWVDLAARSDLGLTERGFLVGLGYRWAFFGVDARVSYGKTQSQALNVEPGATQISAANLASTDPESQLARPKGATDPWDDSESSRACRCPESSSRASPRSPSKPGWDSLWDLQRRERRRTLYRLSVHGRSDDDLPVGSRKPVVSDRLPELEQRRAGREKPGRPVSLLPAVARQLAWDLYRPAVLVLAEGQDAQPGPTPSAGPVASSAPSRSWRPGRRGSMWPSCVPRRRPPRDSSARRAGDRAARRRPARRPCISRFPAPKSRNVRNPGFVTCAGCAAAGSSEEVPHPQPAVARTRMSSPKRRETLSECDRTPKDTSS